MSFVYPIITYFKLRGDQNSTLILEHFKTIITYFKLRGDQNTSGKTS